ncbi:hypothetical protein MAQA_14115 [Listeria aquatica FSL S10-1188]|uniref:Uncharacterized protein n=1 Tax=Listeria aquatica FSL S10-1188 TaxID=1265818 RepID=W7B3L0_9LIST|nr:hypothetical protein MAQA_14115 [Listeria aquatica FSL S10-1188]
MNEALTKVGALVCGIICGTGSVNRITPIPINPSQDNNFGGILLLNWAEILKKDFEPLASVFSNR